MGDTSAPVEPADGRPEPYASLLRHFVDLRDLTHAGVTTRDGKEAAFTRAAALLDPVAVEALETANRALLDDTGEVVAAGPTRDPQGGLVAIWGLTWPLQRESGVAPVRVIAHYGATFHHPHLRGGTTAEWPLNVADDVQAAAQRPLVDAIVAADLHNLVFEADYRIVPAVLGRGQTVTRPMRSEP